MIPEQKAFEFASIVPAPSDSEICGVKAATVSEFKVEGRKVQAVVGMLDVVDRDNEIIVADSFSVGKMQASRWMHNSMPSSKAKGLVREIEQPVAFGNGWVDGNKVISEVTAIESQAGDEWLAYIRAGGEMIRYSQGYTMPIVGAKRRDDGVTELHNVTCWEMSPVPDPSAPGTMTLAAATGMGLGGVGEDFDLKGYISEQVREFFASDEFKETLKNGARWGAQDVVRERAEAEAEAAARAVLGAKAADYARWGLTAPVEAA